jgi:transposase InsO family protein
MSVIAGERSVAEAARREKVSEYNTVRPHEAIARNRPREVHLGLADPTVPTFQTTEILPTP